ncbi:MAG: RHS repeat-associated core domain-containing protein [Candidatus Acidiferrales bacterium]
MTSNYSYDAIYELTGVTQGSNTTESYSYDTVGNRLSSLGVSSYTNNSSNELTSDSNASYTYDTNGNTTSKTASSNTTSYAWDYENRLTSVTLPNSGGTVTFKYDPTGRRIYKQSPTDTSIFVYDGRNLVETLNSTGGVVARYTQDRDIDEPLAMLRGTTTDYYEQDGIGSVTSLSSSTGTLAQTYTYDSFGNTTNSSGSLTNFFRYTAREFDTETNLYFNRARYLDPTTGRFISEDPIRFGSGDGNFYDYVGNNPALYTDPTGRLRIYGNWCGPDWTGGLVEQYDPGHAGIYKPPIDRYDTVCMHHDICYFNCRSTQPCSPDGRSNCFKVCDQIFVGEMPGSGVVPDLLVTGIYWHGKLGPDPGPNSPNCPSCSSPPPKSQPCVGFACLNNR